jgi:hypothetical protein
LSEDSNRTKPAQPTGAKAETVSIQGLHGPADSSGEQADEALVTALRERAATSLEQGLGFICDYGDALAQLRANVALDAASVAECVEALSEYQRDDGSFDPLGCVFSGATTTALREARVSRPLLGALEALSVLGDLRALASGCAERALEFLTRMQRSDGSYGYNDPVAQRAAADGEVSEQAVRDRLFLTGMFGGFAARTPYARPEMLASIASFLGKLFSPERVEGGQWNAIAAFAHFYANGGDPERGDEALQWCGRELERGFRSHRFEAGQTLRVLLYCDSQALPGATFDTVELLDRLLGEQSGDGGFAELDSGGPPGRVGPSIDALIAIRALCHGL